MSQDRQYRILSPRQRFCFFDLLSPPKNKEQKNKNNCTTTTNNHYSQIEKWRRLLQVCINDISNVLQYISSKCIIHCRLYSCYEDRGKLSDHYRKDLIDLLTTLSKYNDNKSFKILTRNDVISQKVFGDLKQQILCIDGLAPTIHTECIWFDSSSGYITLILSQTRDPNLRSQTILRN